MSNNAVLDNILTRRSCRAYTDRPVSKEDLDTILKAAIYAPSGMSRQSWQFTVIRKKENIQELAKVVRETLNRPESYNFYDPDVFWHPMKKTIQTDLQTVPVQWRICS